MSSTEDILKDTSISNLDEEIPNNKLQNSEQDLNKDLYKTYIKPAIPWLIFGLITIYFVFAAIHFDRCQGDKPHVTCRNQTADSNFTGKIDFRTTSCSGFGFLAIVYGFICYGFLYGYFLKPFIVPKLNDVVFQPIDTTFKENNILKSYGVVSFQAAFFVAVGGYLIYDTGDNRNRLIPLSGLAAFLLIGVLMSSNKRKIPWKTIAWGLILQFGFGLLTIRWDVGRNIFGCVGDKVTAFLNYALYGSAFVYGELVSKQHIFAFAALSTVFFLGFFINILYYYGIMQKVVSILGEFLQWIMGTSICESVNSAANIFLGMSEAPLLLKPYLKELTDSEVHSIMTSGFATVSGTVLAAYIGFGAKASDLITASVMSAPAALCFSKIIYPEEEEVKMTKDKIDAVEQEYDSVLDAAAKGASDAFNIVCGIISSVIAFIAFIYFIDGILSWMGLLVGFDGEDTWTVDLIVGKIFSPICFLMGVPWEECEKVGSLIGIKTMVNEFVAFEKMSTMVLSSRTHVIATYAICGFSNPGSIGIMISSMCALMPNRRECITRLVFRAFIGGALVCFMTACIAGLLIPDDMLA